MFSNTGSKNTFTSRVVFSGQKVDAAWPWKTQTQNSSYKLACNLTKALVLDMPVRRETTWSKLGWRSWRCVRFRYSSSLHSSCVEKLKSWLCCGPLLHWRRKTCGSRALITMNSCSWGNFLSGRKGRSCRDGTEEGRAQWNTRLPVLNIKWNPRFRLCCPVPVPSCSRWWQRWMSSWAIWSETPTDGTNQGAKQESTRVHAANAFGDTSWSQGSWDPQSLSELEEKQHHCTFAMMMKKFSRISLEMTLAKYE